MRVCEYAKAPGTCRNLRLLIEMFSNILTVNFFFSFRSSSISLARKFFLLFFLFVFCCCYCCIFRLSILTFPFRGLFNELFMRLWFPNLFELRCTCQVFCIVLLSLSLSSGVCYLPLFLSDFHTFLYLSVSLSHLFLSYTAQPRSICMRLQELNGNWNVNGQRCLITYVISECECGRVR